VTNTQAAHQKILVHYHVGAQNVKTIVIIANITKFSEGEILGTPSPDAIWSKNPLICFHQCHME